MEIETQNLIDKALDENKSLKSQLELVQKSLKIAKAVAENSQKDLIVELAAQRRYITYLENRCAQEGVRIFDEAGDKISNLQSETISGEAR